MKEAKLHTSREVVGAASFAIRGISQYNPSVQKYHDPFLNQNVMSLTHTVASIFSHTFVFQQGKTVQALSEFAASWLFQEKYRYEKGHVLLNRVRVAVV